MTLEVKTGPSNAPKRSLKMRISPSLLSSRFSLSTTATLEARSGLLLPTRRSLSLRSFLPIAPYHNHTKERAHNGRADEREYDGYANGPDAGWEEVVQWVAVVDEGLDEGEECQ